MLQQILRDMWVDPEILAELDETQKQTLFCKMREEQVRRWHAWDEKVKDEDSQPKFSQNSRKHVQFLQGEDGEPWVWVMGEHPDDESVESILAEEARQRALAQARQEVHQLRKSVEKELTHLIDYKPLDSLEQQFDLSPKNVDSLEDTIDLYCTADELRKTIEDLESGGNKEGIEKDYCDDIKLDLKKNTLQFNFIEGKKDLQESNVCRGDGVSLRVAAWERRVAAARAGDILRGLRARRARTLRDAQLQARDEDVVWREQERKAKEAEAAMREIARAAREAHRRSVDPVPCHTTVSAPPSREAVLEWFKSHEQKRGVGLDENNKPVDWFHGLISRVEAERMVNESGEGSFVVRLSERVWGYAISYRAAARCKHYLVDTSDGYRLLGAGQISHRTLADLINYHKTVPITESGGELLMTACVPAQTVVI
ncbi:SH2 domain-containing protein 4B-like [Leptidea sinapis]|uniref:SH2 domain-containing protein 4B-like n=1 Tax=Leptidea sinapis TaxID=189913 RepID=UPI002123F2EE|nr:SH2 domain-containing protein 4B-like [Leptidea sinapis]